MESLDGFVAGATGALGFTFASTITLLSPWLGNGQLLHEPVITSLAQAVFRGLSVAIDQRDGHRPDRRGRVCDREAGTDGCSRPLAHFLRRLPLLFALVIQIGLGFAALAILPPTVLILANLAAIAVVIIVMRVVLHHVLLHGAQGVVVGPPRVCAQCSHLVPTMPFCPNCGVADRAMARHRRSSAQPPSLTQGAS